MPTNSKRFENKMESDQTHNAQNGFKLITSFVNQALSMIAFVSLVNTLNVSRVMWICMFFAISIALLVVVRSEHKLTVKFSEKSQFVNLNQNGTPSGLDALGLKFLNSK